MIENNDSKRKSAADSGKTNESADTTRITSVTSEDPEIIDDSVTNLTQTWSSQKISDQLTYNSDYSY